MTNEDIEKFIDALNAREMGCRIFSASLSAHVEIAKVWVELPQGRACNEGSFDFFFIKNDEENYVAAVLDMTSDLHVFVKEAHRGKGHLTRAMKSVILPKLHHDGRHRQTVTFDDPKMADYCQKNWGFAVTSSSSAELDLTTLPVHESISTKRTQLSCDDVKDINIKLNRAKLYLTMVKEKLEMSCGEYCPNLQIDQLESDISSLKENVINLIEDQLIDGKTRTWKN